VSGQSELAAAASLRRVGLQPVASISPSASVPSGVVISQSPKGGSRAARGARVKLSVSSGPGSAAVPGVEGLPASRAVARLRALGFKPATKSQPSSAVAAGTVIGTEPPAGAEQQLGSRVTVLVSSGPAMLRVPNVVGESQSAAEGALSNAGLEVGQVSSQPSSSSSPGTVLSQTPRGGSSLFSGGKVNLTVAAASSLVTVPAVTGQGEASASAALGGAGLKPKVVTAPTSDPARVGAVIKQSPVAGRRVRKGSTVTLTIGTEAQQTSSTPTGTQTTPSTTPTTTGTTSASPPPAAASPPVAAGP
jgi:serine/threonine-protein kinase